MLEPGGELGFEEGNAIQYTWSVPQDLSALASLMGGDAAGVAKLNTFFTAAERRPRPPLRLGRQRTEPVDAVGVRLLRRPVADPGGGAQDRRPPSTPTPRPTSRATTTSGRISSWYVWAAIGLYPVTPGTADLALASPLFPEVVVTLPDGHRLVVHAPAASASTPYVHSLTVRGIGAPTATAPTATCTTAASKHRR